MLYYNFYPWGSNWPASSGFLTTVTEWAVSGKAHRYVLNSSLSWFSSLLLLGGTYNVPSGTAVVPIISGKVSWTDERWFRDNYASGDGETWHWFWGRRGSADLKPIFHNIVADFEEWYRHMSNTRDEVTDEADDELENLQRMYAPMRSAGYTEEADILMTLMSKVDATRRAEVYYNLTLNDHNRHILGPTLNYINKALRTGNGEMGLVYKSVYVPNTDDYHYNPDDATIGMLDDAIADCQNAYIKYSSRALANGTTVLTAREYEASMNVIQTAQGTSDFNAVLSDLNVLGDIYNIEDSAVIHKNRENDLLNDLIPQAGEKFAGRIHESVDSDYQVLAANQATTESTLKSQKAKASGAAAELQQLIKAYCLRLNEYDGTRFINGRLDWCEQQRSAISIDPYGKYATQALEEHIAWLEEILEKVKNGTLLSDDGEEEQTDKNKYTAQLLDALDEGDLTAAAEAEKKIEEFESDNLNFDGSGGTGDDTDDNGTEGLIKEIERDVINNLEGDNEEALVDDIKALGVLGSKRLEEIKNLLPADSGQEVAKAIDQAIETAKASDLNSADTGAGSGAQGDTGAGSTTGAGGTGAGTGTDGGAGTANDTGANTQSGTGTESTTGAGLRIGWMTCLADRLRICRMTIRSQLSWAACASVVKTTTIRS